MRYGISAIFVNKGDYIDMKKSKAYKNLESLFNRQMKWIFNLPKKGKTIPIKTMFTWIHPET